MRGQEHAAALNEPWASARPTRRLAILPPAIGKGGRKAGAADARGLYPPDGERLLLGGIRRLMGWVRDGGKPGAEMRRYFLARRFRQLAPPNVAAVPRLELVMIGPLR